MKITWLGQAGLLFETEGKIILIDPYLSNSVEKINPKNKRRVAIDQFFLHVRPNVIVLTHDHLDHTDPETLAYYLTDKSEILVLASGNAWKTAKIFGGKNNYIKFECGTEWTYGNILFKAVHAEHSDEKAIGVIINVEGKKFYITGDTLYSEKIFKMLPPDIDYVFLPVNGRGNNMNFYDGKRFCERIGATAIPIHCGMFDDINMQEFPYSNKIVPISYKEIKL